MQGELADGIAPPPIAESMQEDDESLECESSYAYG